MLNTTIYRKAITLLSTLGVLLGITPINMEAVHISADPAAPPTILDVNPNEIPNATNIYITVTGDNFIPTRH